MTEPVNRGLVGVGTGALGGTGQIGGVGAMAEPASVGAPALTGPQVGAQAPTGPQVGAGSRVGGQAPIETQAVTEATEHQPGARAMLVASLKHGPSHAYVFQGPPGSGKRTAARAFAAEILASGAAAADASGGAESATRMGDTAAAEARRRALIDPSPHPDLIWVKPDGAQHRVEEIREQVIRAAAYRPYEGGRRVFVIESAEAMREESQNALLKTLEEPPSFAHLVLLSESPAGMLPTIRSRCQLVEFRRLPAAAVEEKLRGETMTDGAPADPGTVRAAARLSGGDTTRARYLLGPEGAALRDAAIEWAASATPGQSPPGEPWSGLLDAAEGAGKLAEQAAQDRIATAEEYGAKLSKTESGQAVRREARKARTEVLDLGLELCEIWFRDLAAVAVGAEDVVMNSDRIDSLREQAAGLDASVARAAAELVGAFRARLTLNVSEELALEALHSRLRRTLGG